MHKQKDPINLDPGVWTDPDPIFKDGRIRTQTYSIIDYYTNLKIMSISICPYNISMHTRVADQDPGVLVSPGFFFFSRVESGSSFFYRRSDPVSVSKVGFRNYLLLVTI